MLAASCIRHQALVTAGLKLLIMQHEHFTSSGKFTVNETQYAWYTAVTPRRFFEAVIRLDDGDLYASQQDSGQTSKHMGDISKHLRNIIHRLIWVTQLTPWLVC